MTPKLHLLSMQAQFWMIEANFHSGFGLERATIFQDAMRRAADLMDEFEVEMKRVQDEIETKGSAT